MSTDAQAARASVAVHLDRIWDAIQYMGFELDGQNRSMVLEMVQVMLTDLMADGELKPMVNYVKRFCTVADGPEDCERIAADI